MSQKIIKFKNNENSKLPWITILGIFQFFILSSLAMVFYSGGNLNDPNSLRYSFCLNKFSDLGMTFSYNGKSNWISFCLFNSSLILIGLTMIPFIISVSHHFKNNSIIKSKLKQSLLILGIASCICFSCVGLTPKNLTWAIIPHFSVMCIAFMAIMIFEICYSKCIFQTSYPNFYAWVNMVTAFIQFVFFLFVFNLIPYSLIFSCVSQKIIVYVQMVNIFIQIIGFLNHINHINHIKEKYDIFEQEEAKRKKKVLDLYMTSQLFSFLIKSKEYLQYNEISIMNKIR